MLQLEVGAVRCGAARRVDPGSGRPARARAHQRGVQRAVGIDGEARHAAVEHRDGARLEAAPAPTAPPARRRSRRRPGRRRRRRPRPRGRTRAITSTGSARTPRRSASGTHSSASGAAAGTHTRAAPVVYSWRLSSSVYTGSASASTAAVNAFCVGPAERDAGVGQVGVDGEIAVSRLVGAAAGRGDAGADQRDHQLTRQRRRLRLRRRHHLGHRHRAHAARRRGPAPPTTTRTSRRRGCPASTGAVAAVDGATRAAVVHQPEAAADHRVTDLAHRQRARHRARPAQPQQAVGTGELVDGGPAVDAGHAVPQRQGLRVAQHITDAAADDQPLAERAAVGLHRGRHRPTSRPPAPSAAGATGLRRPADAPDTRRRRPARCRPRRRRSARDRAISTSELTPPPRAGSTRSR